MTAQVETRAPGRPSLKWLLGCAAVCVAVFGYRAFSPSMGSGNLAYEIGASLPHAAVLAGVLHLLFKKRESATTGWLGFLLIFATFIAAAAVSTNRHRDEARQVVAELQQTLSQVQEANSKGAELPPPRPQGTPARSGISKAGEIARAMLDRTVAQRREYEGELMAIGWAKVLDGQRLRKDAGLAESRAMLLQAKGIVEKYKLKTPTLFEQARRDIENADLGLSDKQSMLAGFDKSIARGKQQMEDMWSLEGRAMSQFEKIFGLLGANRSAWQIENGRLMFHRQADLDLFNSYIAQVQAIVKQQEEMQSKAMETARSTLDEIAR